MMPNNYLSKAHLVLLGTLLMSTLLSSMQYSVANAQQGNSQKSSALTETRPKKILVYGSFLTGQSDFMIEVAATIASKGPELRQVYQLLPEGSKDTEYVKSRGVTPITIPGLTQDYVNSQVDMIRAGEVPDYTSFMKEQLSFLFNEQAPFLLELKEQRFDMLIVERYEDQQFIANFLETPLVVKVIERVVEPIIIQEIGGNPSHSSQLSTLRNQLFGIQRGFETLEDKQLSFTFRFFNFISYVLHKAYIYPSLQHDLAGVIPDEYSEIATTHRFPNMSIFTGIEGINPPIAVPPALKFVYPKYKTQYEDEYMAITPELNTFMSKRFPKGLALVTFGSQRQPSAYDLETLTDYMVSNQNYGFIVALQNPQFYPETVISKLTNSPNIFTSGWLPQTTILNDNRVKLFFTHGGLNSYYEGVEARKAMIIIPFHQDEQQRFVCDFAHLQHFASCVYSTSQYEIEQAVQRAEEKDYYAMKVTQLSKVSKKFGESKKDLNYWIDYCLKVGTNHLQMQQYHVMRVD